MRSTLAVFALFLFAGCGGSTEPKQYPPLDLSFTSSGSATGGPIALTGQPIYQCPFSITATANAASPDDFASWIDADINYRLTATGQTYDQFVDFTDLQDWFGSDRIKAGATQTGRFALSWVSAFTVSMVLRYTVYSDANPFGESHSTIIPLTCR